MKASKTLFFIVFSIVIVVSFYVTSRHFKERYFQDLRTRVTGSRLLDAHKSAYFYKWKRGDDIRLLNFTERQSEIVNGNTVTPTVLFFTQYLSRLPFFKIAIFWYFLGYLSLLSIILLFTLKILNSSSSSNGFLLIILSLFPLLVSWRLHCTSGQIYIHYTFLAVAAFYCYSKEKWVLAAILAGIVSCARLPYCIIFLPLLLYKRNYQFMLLFIATIVLLVMVTILTYGTQVWVDYFNAMPFYALENANAIPNVRDSFVIDLPKYLEGMPTFKSDALTIAENLDKADIFSVQKLLVTQHLPSSAKVMYTLFTSFSIMLFLFINYVNPHFYRSQSLLILFATLLMFLLEYFLPALRFNYNFVQFLVLLSVISFFNIVISPTAKWLLITGILLNAYRIPWIPESYSLGETLCLVSIIMTLIQNKAATRYAEDVLSGVGRFFDVILRFMPRSVPIFNS